MIRDPIWEAGGVTPPMRAMARIGEDSVLERSMQSHCIHVVDVRRMSVVPLRETELGIDIREINDTVLCNMWSWA